MKLQYLPAVYPARDWVSGPSLWEVVDFRLTLRSGAKWLYLRMIQCILLLSLSVYLSTYTSVYLRLSVYLFTYLSLHLSIFLLCLCPPQSLFLQVALNQETSGSLFTFYLPLYLSIFQSMYLSVLFLVFPSHSHSGSRTENRKPDVSVLFPTSSSPRSHYTRSRTKAPHNPPHDPSFRRQSLSPVSRRLSASPHPENTSLSQRSSNLSLFFLSLSSIRTFDSLFFFAFCSFFSSLLFLCTSWPSPPLLPFSLP